MGSLKVAIITSAAPYGKGESFVVAEVNALSESGIDIVLVPTFLRTKKNFTLNAAVKLAAEKHLSLTVMVTFLKLCIKKPLKVFRAYFSILSLNPITLLKNTMVFPKAVWSYQLLIAHKVDHIHAHWASTPSTVAMVASKLTGIPWSMTTHRGDIVSNNLLYTKVTHASFTRFISNSGAELASRICRQEIEGKFKLLHMGVNVPVLKDINLNTDDKNIILCPANFNEVKGHHFLFEALTKVRSNKSFELHLAGSGPLESHLRKLTEDLNIQHLVKFLGQLQHNDLLQLYRKRQIGMVVLPSVDLGGGVHEGIPVSLMEAMAHSVPVISTSTGGIPELLENGAGILVPHSNSNALAEAISSLLEDDTLAKKQGKSGRDKVNKSFNLSMVSQTLIDWFHL